MGTLQWTLSPCQWDPDLSGMNSQAQPLMARRPGADGMNRHERARVSLRRPLRRLRVQPGAARVSTGSKDRRPAHRALTDITLA